MRADYSCIILYYICKCSVIYQRIYFGWVWAALELGIAVPLELGIVELRIDMTPELGIASPLTSGQGL